MSVKMDNMIKKMNTYYARSRIFQRHCLLLTAFMRAADRADFVRSGIVDCHFHYSGKVLVVRERD
jgi:hypothetical protein